MNPKAPGALCDMCPLAMEPFVPSYLPEGADVIVVGEAPGEDEVREGVPFVGQSGKLLGFIVEQEGFDYGRVARTNVVSCRPPRNRTPTDFECECCHGRLRQDIDRSGAGTVLGLGKVASDTLAGSFGRGVWRDWQGKHLITSWHPAYVLRKPSEVEELVRDVGVALRGYQPPRFESPPEPIIIRDVPTLQDWLSKCPENAYVAYDLETDNTIWYDRPNAKADPIIMLMMAWDERFGIVLDDEMLYDVDGTRHVLQKFFDRKDITFCTQNGKFDQVFLRTHINVRARNDIDTMLAHYVLNENIEHGLKAQATWEFGLPDYEKELVQKYLSNRNDRYSKVPFDKLALYGCWDVVITRALAMIYEERMIEKGLIDWPFRNVLMRGSEHLVEIEIEGIPVDIEYLTKAHILMNAEMEKVLNEVHAIVGRSVNLNSPQQVATVLYDELKLPQHIEKGVKTRTTAQGHVLQFSGTDPFVDALLYYRRVGKLNSSYVENMLSFVDTNGYVHPTVYVTGTEVGRLAYRDPAAQTVPRPGEKAEISPRSPYYGRPYTDGAIIRGAIAAHPGMMLSIVDISQAELRTAACLAHEDFLIEVYRRGEDLHSQVAIAMYGSGYTKEQRVQCKMFNFSYLYGGNEYSFAMDAGLNIAVARAFVKNYNQVMPRLAQYRVDQYKSLVANGYVETLFGRRRRFPLITDANRDEARKACVHQPIAGTSSDLTFLAALDAHDQGIPVRLLVHDSIVAHVRESDAEDVAEIISQSIIENGKRFLPEVPWVTDKEVRARWATPPSLS